MRCISKNRQVDSEETLMSFDELEFGVAGENFALGMSSVRLWDDFGVETDSYSVREKTQMVT